jgi:hypothetical protein
MSESADESKAPRPPSTRPADVDTGFWLWVIAVPLMAISYLVDVVGVPGRPALVVGVSTLFLIMLVAVVVTFLMLMRAGYRWARTLLTAGGLASIVSVATGLFTVDRPTAAAMVFAVTGIFGAVLIAGGIYMLHRKESHAFFVR